jgi:predicted O-methyltransferase YrrM
MNPITIPREAFSTLIWQRLNSPTRSLGKLFDSLDLLRLDADYNTGSIDHQDAKDLQQIVGHFQPEVIAEVGTFIGRSTTTMAQAMPEGGTIYTCDMNNDIKLPEIPGRTIVQYPKKSSTEMFETFISRKVCVDLFYIDGRLNSKDYALILDLMHDATVFVLDDFEGIEKGVVNAMGLMRHLRNYALVYPRNYGKTAMMLPPKLVQFTAQ